MSVHEQYDLIFRIRQHPFWGTWPICNVNHEGTSPPLQGELRFFLYSSDSKDGGIIDTIVEEIDNILNGKWTGFEDEEDNIFYTPTDNKMKLDLNNGFAYFALDSGWNTLPKIPLTDLKAIFQEWIAFRDSVHSIRNDSKWHVKWLNKLRKTGKNIVKIVKRDRSF